VREVTDGLHRVHAAGVDDLVRTQLAREFQPLGDDIDAQDAAPQRLGLYQSRQAHGTKPEDRQLVVAGDVQLLQRRKRGSCATGDQRPIHERKLRGQGQAVLLGRQDVLGGRAVSVGLYARPMRTELPVPLATEATVSTTEVVVHADPVTRRNRGDARADLLDDARWLVPHHLVVTHPQLLRRAVVEVQIAATDSRDLHLHQNPPRPDLRLGNLPHLCPGVSKNDQPFQRCPPDTILCTTQC